MANVQVDFTGVTSFSRCAEGKHIATLCQADMKTTADGDPMIVAQFEVLKGESKGCKVYANFPLNEKSLWKLKQYMEALGVKADGKLKINTDKLMGRNCFIEVAHEDYKGTLRANIIQFLAIPKAEEVEDEVEDEAEAEVEPTPPPKAKPKTETKPDTKAKPKPAPKPAPESDDDDWTDA